MHGSGLELALVFLLAAVIAVPVFKRFGLGAVLAYLVAGVVLGPDGLALVRDADRILNAAEIGVVMMLFVIGLELSPSRLRVMRKPVFGAGGLQVLLSALLLGGIALLFEHHWKTALVVGLGLALSSTAVSLQLLSEALAEGGDAARFLQRRFERTDEVFARLNAALATEGALSAAEASALDAVHATFVADGLACTLDRRPRLVVENAALTTARAVVMRTTLAHGLPFDTP